MKAITNLVLRLVGAGKAVEALNGETSKTYAAGAQKILTGAATLLGGLAMLAGQFLEAKDGAGYLAIVQGAAQSPAAGAIVAGWYLIQDGRADIGQRHAVAKAAEPPK